jgi:predicted dehydrogenase
LDVTKTAAGRWLEGAEFLFENGRLAVSIPSPMATEMVAEVTLDDPQAGYTNKRLETGHGWCFEHQARGFVDALVGTAEPATSGDGGLTDLELIEQIWQHIAGGA